MGTLEAIIVAYLEERPNSNEVLNDLLEERGQERIAQDVKQADRLAIVLDEILNAECSGSLACDFAEHVLSFTSIETQFAAKKALAAKRAYLSGEGDLKEIVELADAALNEWQPDNTPAARAAWSIWAASLARPSKAAASAQAAREGELDWQIERTKAVLLEGEPTSGAQ